VNLPGMDGITAAEVLRSEHSPSAVIILSLHDDSATRERAQTAGAVAFVSKHAQPDVLLEAIRRTASGSHRCTQDGGAERLKPGAQNPLPGLQLGLLS
jgi:DNA-binding NarL/FixJ family response regulator